jgi:hypothetical protein
MPLVAETRSATDRQHAQDDDTRHRQHPHVEAPLSEETAAQSPEIESPPKVGTLIDVRV